jgi:hypothetical protein
LWQQLLEEIDREIRRVGFWSGEARDLRDGAEMRRLTPAGGARLVAALRDAGFECDPVAIRYESEPVMIGRIGASDLTRIIEQLLPAIRDADRAVPVIATFRDANVARLALRAWPGIVATDRSTSTGR